MPKITGLVIKAFTLNLGVSRFGPVIFSNTPICDCAFTFLDQVLLRPLPYPHPEKFLRVGSMHRDGGDFRITGGSPISSLTGTSLSFESLKANGPHASQSIRRKRGGLCFGCFFGVLGVAPTLGRAFTAEERTATEVLVQPFY